MSCISSRRQDRIVYSSAGRYVYYEYQRWAEPPPPKCIPRMFYVRTLRSPPDI